MTHLLYIQYWDKCLFREICDALSLDYRTKGTRYSSIEALQACPPIAPAPLLRRCCNCAAPSPVHTRYSSGSTSLAVKLHTRYSPDVTHELHHPSIFDFFHKHRERASQILLLLFFTWTHRYLALRGHKKRSRPRKIRKTFKISQYRVGKHDGFHTVAHDANTHKGLINLQTWQTSPLVSAQLPHRSFVCSHKWPTRGYWLLTTSTAAIIAAVWRTACTVQTAR